MLTLVRWYILSFEMQVVGIDIQLSYAKLAYASVLLQSGRPFIASNADAYDSLPDGIFPGNGAIVEALTVASGKSPLIIGKPYTAQIDVFLRDRHLSDQDKSK